MLSPAQAQQSAHTKIGQIRSVYGVVYVVKPSSSQDRHLTLNLSLWGINAIRGEGKCMNKKEKERNHRVSYLDEDFYT